MPNPESVQLLSICSSAVFFCCTPDLSSLAAPPPSQAVGVRVKRWITMHGLSLNVRPNLEHFRHIVPCGIDDKPVGSREALPSLSAGGGSHVIPVVGFLGGGEGNVARPQRATYQRYPAATYIYPSGQTALPTLLPDFVHHVTVVASIYPTSFALHSRLIPISHHAPAPDHHYSPYPTPQS